MKLKNRFSEEDKISVWSQHQFCAICKSNQNCSLHHILGTRSSSILNSIMLCYLHHKEADGHNVSDIEYQKPLLQYSIKQALKENYSFKEKDIEFYNSHKSFYD